MPQSCPYCYSPLQPDAVMLGTCVTGADGVCTITKNSDSVSGEGRCFSVPCCSMRDHAVVIDPARSHATVLVVWS